MLSRPTHRRSAVGPGVFHREDIMRGNLRRRQVVRYLLKIMAFLLIASCSLLTGDRRYDIGERVDVGNDTIYILDDAEFQGTRLVAEFIIRNEGREDRRYDLWGSLTARDENENVLYPIQDCGTNIKGIIHPGEQKIGSICWNREDADVVRIFYRLVFITGTQYSEYWVLQE
jgi:hypothetical protein